MSCEFVVDTDRHLVRVTITGIVSSSELRDCRERIRTDPEFRVGLSVLIDARGADTHALTNEDVRALAEGSIVDAGVRRAFVADHAATIGLARIFATYRELRQGREKTAVFTNVDDAERWLSEPSDSR